MTPLDEFVAEARRLTVEAFVQTHGQWFLLRPPSNVEGLLGDPPAFQTLHGRISEIVSAASPDDSEDDEWQVASVHKRPGNPFPRRISVGRARSCDVVFRLPNVSKLHATFVIQPDGSVGLFDADSANGSAVRGQQLVPRQVVPVEHGNRVDLGGIHLRFVDGAWLHRICREGREIEDRTGGFA